MEGMTWIVPAAVVALAVLGIMLYRLVRYIQKCCVMKGTGQEENDFIENVPMVVAPQLVSAASFPFRDYTDNTNEEPDNALDATRDLVGCNTNDTQSGPSVEGQTLGEEDRMPLKARKVLFDVPPEESVRQDTAHKFLDTRKKKISDISGIPFVGSDNGKRYGAKSADVDNAASLPKGVFFTSRYVKYVKEEKLTGKEHAKATTEIEEYVTAKKGKVQEMRLKLVSIQELEEELSGTQEDANEHLIPPRHDRRDSEGAEIDKGKV